MKDNKKSKRRIFIIFSILTAVLFAAESFLLDDLVKIEGIKLGLYNMFIVFAVLNMNAKYGYALFAVKLLVSVFIGASVLLYPFFGGLISVSAMIIAKKYFGKKVGYLGIGVIGALSYNISTYIIAAISLSSMSVFYNIPTVLILSVLFGALTGSCAYLMTKIKALPREYGGTNENR